VLSVGFSPHLHGSIAEFVHELSVKMPTVGGEVGADSASIPAALSLNDNRTDKLMRILGLKSVVGSMQFGETRSRDRSRFRGLLHIHS
jgi:hypothetical protein